jgi:membrane protease YdiL (CAAX protease family)
MWDFFFLCFYGLLGLGGLGVFFWNDCWKPAKVLGPDRWDENENPAFLMILAGAGFLAWILATQAMLDRSDPSATSQPTTRPMDLHDVWVGTLAQMIGFVTLIIGNLSLRKNALASLGLGKFAKAPLPALAAAMIALPLVFATSLLTQKLWILIHFEHPEKHEVLEVLIKSSAFEKWLPIASAVIMAPLFEETLFRGHLQTFFKRSFQTRGNETAAAWMSILISSAMFMIVHPAWTYPPIFVLAVCMGYVYERTGNLWSTIFLHMIFNSAQVTFTILQTTMGK